MKFDVGPREAEFGIYNNRAENHGKEKVKALDLPFTICVTLKELDQIAPCQTGKLSELLYDGKKNLQTFCLSPMAINRKPENISVEIFDIEARANAKPLRFEGCKIKDPVIHLAEKAKDTYMTGKLQISDIDPDDVIRIIENVEGKKRKMQFWMVAPSLPLTEAEQQEEEGKGKDKGTAEGENDQDEDED